MGDIEGMAYLSAFERFQCPKMRNRLMNVHVSLILEPKAAGEPKTKPMQNSVRICLRFIRRFYFGLLGSFEKAS